MMKTLNDYFAMNYRMEIVEDKDEGGFVVSFPELPGCITCGETVESAVANALDAKKAWLEAALEDGIEIHEPDSLEEKKGNSANLWQLTSNLKNEGFLRQKFSLLCRWRQYLTSFHP